MDWLNGEYGQGGSITRGIDIVLGGGGAEFLEPADAPRDVRLHIQHRAYMPIALARHDEVEINPSINGNVIGFTVNLADMQSQPEGPRFVQMAPSVRSASVHIAQVLPLSGMVPGDTLPLGYA